MPDPGIKRWGRRPWVQGLAANGFARDDGDYQAGSPAGLGQTR